MHEEIKKVLTEAGSTRYYKAGTSIPHRLNGPAVIRANGDKFWYKDGERHCVSGPAVEIGFEPGSKTPRYRSWYIEGKEYTEEEFNNYLTEIKIYPPIESLTNLIGQK